MMAALINTSREPSDVVEWNVRVRAVSKQVSRLPGECLIYHY